MLLVTWDRIRKDHPARRWQWSQADAVPLQQAVAQRIWHLPLAASRLANVQVAYAVRVFLRTAVAMIAVQTAFVVKAELVIAAANPLQSLSAHLASHVQVVAVPRSK